MRTVAVPAIFVSIFVSMILLGCAAITPPPEYQELKGRMAVAPAEEQQYDDARAHLKAAEEALQDRDEAALARFAKLGIIEARIAESRLLQMSLIVATEQEVEKSRQLAQDVATWRAKVEQLLAAEAREQVREHIEAVIEKETLAAAAAEELQTHMGDVDEEKLKTARHRVAEELIARAVVRSEIASMLSKSGGLMPEQVRGIDGAVSLMKKALDEDDVASVYRYGEQNLALFTDYLDDAWRVSGRDAVAVSKHVAAVLHRANLDAGVESIGRIVSLPASLANSGRGQGNELDGDVRDLLTQAASVLENDPKLVMLVVISGNGRSMATKKRVATTAEQIRKYLTAHTAEQAISPASVSVLTFQGERPLRALTGTGMQGALVFVPVP